MPTTRQLTYAIARTDEKPTPKAVWDAPAWRGVEALELGNYMGKQPAHRPRTRARLLYDDQALYVIFLVNDRYVRSVVTEYQGPVFADSCVELFFTPGENLSEGYFNIETNCGGAQLIRHQLSRSERVVPVAWEDARRLRTAHSAPATVDPEIDAPLEWCVEYAVPYAMIERYAPVRRPAPGVAWRANLYKIADSTSHPHWLTWAPVDLPEPDFHQSAFFGTLVFGG